MSKSLAFLLLSISGTLSSQLSFIRYDAIPATREVGDVNETTPVWEISGLSHNHNDVIPLYYGISDTILKSFPKRIFSFSVGFTDGEPSIVDIAGVIMEEPDNYPLFTADTENVVYLEDNDNIYFIVSTEGYRKYDTFTNFWLYNDVGAFLGNLSYSTDIFQEQGTLEDPTYGFPDGDGCESMSANQNFSTVIFIGSHGLVQDDCISCVRISVNAMDYSGSIPTWTETAQYMYNTEDKDTRVTDATIVTDGIIVVLERKFVNTTEEFVTKAYEIDLKDVDSTYDVKDCRTYDSSCPAFGNVVPKTFIKDFADLTDIPNVKKLHFDAIAAGSGHNDECENGHFMVTVTDNDEEADTIFAYLCYTTDAANTPFTMVISVVILFVAVLYI